MLSKFFIERPVLSNVIAFLMILLGAVALVALPIAQFPQITPPTVQVTATYPGASARTMVDKVAIPIELQVNGVEGMIYMQSTSTNQGTYTLTVSFEIGTDPDTAQVLVQNRVSAALAQLPSEVQTQGVITQTKSTAVLQLITLTSPDGEFDSLFLSNFATLNLQNELARIPGVGGVTVFGDGEYSMRVWLQPDQLEMRSLSVTDVVNAIENQNTEVTAGQIGAPPSAPSQAFQLTINANGELDSVEEFENIIVKSSTDDGGQITRMKDIARVELGAESYSQFATFDGRPTGGVAIYQIPGSNAIKTARAVRAKLDELTKTFPPGIQIDVPLDNTVFVRESVKEVFKTLIEAGILVLIVIVLFLQDWRAALVPATTVPVTIIGAFAAMAAMGFTINTLTLFAIVLAIGIVVDDAIVVVEGAAKHIERGKSPHDAAIAAMNELFAPIVGVTLVLISVFLPSAFLPGIVGEMYRQFALVITATALLSGINAITLKPTQCALWLRAQDPNRKKNFIFRGFNAIYDPIERRYAELIGGMVKRSWLMTAVAAILVACSLIGLYRTPTGFLPTEDQGMLTVAVQMPDGASLGRTKAAMSEVSAALRAIPGIKDTIIIGGSGSSPIDSGAALFNGGLIYAIFESSHDRGRDQSLGEIERKALEAVAEIQDARSLVLLPPAVQGLGLSEGFQLMVELSDGSFDYARLQEAAEELAQAASDDPLVDPVFSPFRSQVPQLAINVNRRQVETYGVEITDVFDAIETYLGSTYVNQFLKFGRTFMVYAQADTPYRLAEASIKNFTVPNSSGDMVPLGSLISISPDLGPNSITLYNLYPAAALLGKAAPDASSGQALASVGKLANSILPEGMRFEWTGLAYQEQIAGTATVLAFCLALVLVYFVLAGQYESWYLPIAVIFAVPLAVLGTVVAIRIAGLDNNLYVQIGLILLIALSAKNAILVVEMGRQGREQGLEVVDAAIEAARRRFRPIVMTSFTFILGVVPLILSTGAGAASRFALGLTVASGMFASTCLAVVFVPSFFVILQRIHERSAKRAAGAQ